MNEVVNSILKRGSLRGYKEQEISKEHLDTILNCAMRAPSAGNMMEYSIIVVKDEEKKKKLSVSCDNQPFIAKAPVLLVFVADMSKWYKYYEINDTKRFVESKEMEFKGPGEGNFLLATQDAVIAAQNAVIGAESIGIGSCYIGDIMENVEYHQELLNLPKYTYPVTMLTLGYYPENYNVPLKDRFDKKYVVFEEEYKELSKDDINDMYKELDKKWFKENKYGAENYAQMQFSFKINSKFMNEMNRSIKIKLNEWSEEKL